MEEKQEQSVKILSENLCLVSRIYSYRYMTRRRNARFSILFETVNGLQEIISQVKISIEKVRVRVREKEHRRGKVYCHCC